MATRVGGETIVWSLVVSFTQLAGGKVQKDRCIWVGWWVGTRGRQDLFDSLLEWVIARVIAELQANKKSKDTKRDDKINANA